MRAIRKGMRNKRGVGDVAPYKPSDDNAWDTHGALTENQGFRSVKRGFCPLFLYFYAKNHTFFCEKSKRLNFINPITRLRLDF